MPPKRYGANGRPVAGSWHGHKSPLGRGVRPAMPGRKTEATGEMSMVSRNDSRSRISRASVGQRLARNVPWQYPWIWTVAITLALHYVWEMAQAPLFTNFAGTGFWGHAWPCFRAALGDVAIAGLSYTVAAVAVRRTAWLFQPRWKVPFAIWLVLGLIVTIGFELYALQTERWDYRPMMPTIGGTAITPLAQWLVVPSLTLVAARWLARNGE